MASFSSVVFFFVVALRERERLRNVMHTVSKVKPKINEAKQLKIKKRDHKSYPYIIFKLRLRDLRAVHASKTTVVDHTATIVARVDFALFHLKFRRK